MKKSSLAQTRFREARRLTAFIANEQTTVDELAARCQLAPAQIQAVLADHLPLDLETLYAIAHSTDVSLDYLTGLASAPMRYRGKELTEDEKEFMREVKEIKYEFGPIGGRFVKALLCHLLRESEIAAQAESEIAI